MNKIIADKALRELITRHIYLRQTELVDNCLDVGLINEDYIDNYYDKEEPGEDGSESEAQKNILEWWAISDWLESKLTAIGQPVLSYSGGTWWGRLSNGKLFDDQVLREIINQCEVGGIFNVPNDNRSIENE